jgi:Glycosyl hydrolases family 43
MRIATMDAVARASLGEGEGEGEGESHYSHQEDRAPSVSSRSNSSSLNRAWFLRARRRVCRTPLWMVLLALLPFAVAVGAAFDTIPAPAAGAANWAPVHAGDFPDPTILSWNGVYYAFATQSTAPVPQIVNVQVSTSVDGVNWVPLGTDALPQLPSWAQKGNTWAPSVVYDSATARFVMYYTATEITSGEQCIGEATSLTPLGPYVDTSSLPVECQLGIGGSIDPDIFTDPQTGTSSLLWKNDGNRVGWPTEIWSVHLGADFRPIPSATPVALLSGADEAWQGASGGTNGVIEGPFMYYLPGSGPGGAGGTYYLFYAGGDVFSSTYAIGWASCSGPAGPCTDAPPGENPILTTAPGMSGPGGPDVFTLPSGGGGGTGGQLVMAFAAWQGGTIGYGTCGIRPMYLADLSFSPSASGPETPSLVPNDPGASPAASPSCPQPPPPPPGYWQVGSDGGVFSFGSAGFYGSTGSLHLNKPVVGMAATPDGKGYWLVAADGGIFAYGDAGFYGSTGSIVLNKPIVAMVPTLDGQGYWLFASDGGVFAFGDAPFLGSAANQGIAAPITAAASSFLGGGYWLADANGGVHPFGNAPYEGQPWSAPGGYRITGIAGTHNSNGYWLASANGNVAGFGNAAPYGSEYGTALNSPIVGMSATHDGAGYWLQGGDGGIFTFGDAPFLGSMGGLPLNAPMVGIAAL